MTLATVRDHQISSYGGERDTKEQGAHIISAARTDLSFIFNSFCATFSSYFIPASHLKKITVVVEISTTKFARHDAICFSALPLTAQGAANRRGSFKRAVCSKITTKPFSETQTFPMAEEVPGTKGGGILLS